MRDAPSPELVERLHRLGVSPSLHWWSVSAAAGRIAGVLPLLNIDSARLARTLATLSPYQARELGAGRGLQLMVRTHLLRKRLPLLGYAEVFETVERTLIRAKINSARQGQVAESIAQLRQQLQECTSEAICRFAGSGADADTAWSNGLTDSREAHEEVQNPQDCRCVAGDGLRVRIKSRGPVCGPTGKRARPWSRSAASRHVF